MTKRCLLLLATPALLLLGVDAKQAPRKVQVVAGGYHTLALGSDGSVWAWGFNGYGQSGEGTTYDHPVPYPSHPPTGLKIKSLAAGEDHSLLLTEDGRVFACGRNDHGQLGVGTTSNASTWTEVKALDQVIQVVGGQHHTFALRKDGTVWGWGDNQHSQISPDMVPMRTTPMRIADLQDIKKIVSGTTHGLALTSAGVVWGWGNGREGQLGPKRQETRCSPQVIRLSGSIMHLAAGAGFSLALKRDGTVLAWGRNDRGQLGNGTKNSSPSPALIPDLTKITFVGAGYEHGIALDRAGRVWSWGDNNLGQLGNSNPSYSLEPGPLSLPEGKPSALPWQLVVGGYHTVIYKPGSSIFSVGYNHYNQLGDWSGVDRRIPVRIRKEIP